MKLEGLSVAGVETCIEVPELRLVLDMGRCTRTAVRHPVVLVSHGHLDHIGAIAQHAARRAMMSMSEGIYLVPSSVAPQVEAMFNAAGQLDGQVIPRRVCRCSQVTSLRSANGVGCVLFRPFIGCRARATPSGSGVAGCAPNFALYPAHGWASFVEAAP